MLLQLLPSMILNSSRRLLCKLIIPKTKKLITVVCSSLSTLSPSSNPFSLSKNPQETLHSIPIPHLLNLLYEGKQLKPMKNLILKNSLFDQENLIERFILRCFDLGAPRLALSTFSKIGKPDLFLQNRVVKCLCDDGLFEDVLSVFRKCRILGYPLDNYTLPFVIKACCYLGDVRVGEGVHCLVLKTGYVYNIVVQTSLIDFYGKCGRMESACYVFETISQPDLVSWSALMSGYSLEGRNDEAMEVFREIRAIGLKPNVSILATVVPICTRSRCIYAGKSLHGYSVKTGFFENESIMPALISLYSSDGDIYVVRNLFEHSLVRNVATWNATICAYTQNHKPDESLEMFKQMMDSDMKPNMITYLSIIPSCVDFGCISYGESLHACVVKAGLVNQHFVLTSLLSTYAKLGELSSSEFLFTQMRDRNILSWNSLISAYVHHMQWDLSLAKLREMQFEGFNPDAITIISVLSACSELKAILPGKSAHSYGIRKGFDTNLNMSNALLSFYSTCSQTSYSFMLFNKLILKNTVSWNTLISGCVHDGDTSKAVVLLNQMQEEGTKFDLVTLISILPCYNKLEELAQGMTIHSYALKFGFDSDVSLSNALVSMYLNCGGVEAGELVFESIQFKSVVSWNSMITGYRYQNLNDKVMLYFCRMLNENQKPNYVTLLNLLPVCYSLLQGKSFHAYAFRRKIELETSLVTSFMLMYARFEITKYCLLLFEMGDKRNISLWNAVISAHVQTRSADKAFSFVIQLLQMDVEPDYMTILSLISACCQLNDINFTNSMMDYVMKTGFDKDVAVTNALIDLYAKSGNMSIARKIFDYTDAKDNITWGAMINGYGLHGDGEAVIALVSEMELLNLEPDDITYLTILSACSHTGLVEQGRYTFDSMLNKGVLPKMEHYACMVDLLGRTGHLYEAYEIVKKLPHRPSVSLLESVLGACIVHGDYKLGEEIGTLLIEMDPRNSGSCVMLHNVYAAAGRWADAIKVRSIIEERQLMKVPGFSLVEGSKS